MKGVQELLLCGFPHLKKKREAGEILYDLTITENHAADIHKAYLVLARPVNDLSLQVLPNFREGDAIVLYQRNQDTDNVTNKMVFKREYRANHRPGYPYPSSCFATKYFCASSG